MQWYSRLLSQPAMRKNSCPLVTVKMCENLQHALSVLKYFEENSVLIEE
jgi:hypothetical protein